MIKPTIGRIVYYFEQGRDQPYPAIVLGVVSDREIQVLAFHHSFPYVTLVQTQLLQDKDEPTARAWCAWMDYQKGQAAKTDNVVDSTQKALKSVSDQLSEYQKELELIHKEIARLEARINGAPARQAAQAGKNQADANQQEGGR